MEKERGREDVMVPSSRLGEKQGPLAGKHSKTECSATKGHPQGAGLLSLEDGDEDTKWAKPQTPAPGPECPGCSFPLEREHSRRVWIFSDDQISKVITCNKFLISVQKPSSQFVE